MAQLYVAAIYQAGQGTEASAVRAYAWAKFAAQSGMPKGEQLAELKRPRLPPGSEQVADSLTAPYTTAALEKSLLPKHTGYGISGQRKSLVESRRGNRRQRCEAPPGGNSGDGLATELRDPKRALELLSSLKGESDDPTTFEIWAAAQAAEGNFAHAAKSELARVQAIRSCDPPQSARAP